MLMTTTGQTVLCSLSGCVVRKEKMKLNGIFN